MIAEFNLNHPQGDSADKLAYGKNHYYAFGAAVERRFDSECSNIWNKSQPVFDDPTISFACAPLSITEANQTSTCTMSLSSASSTNVVVSFAYTGSSLPTDDYTGIKTSVTIAKGATSTTWGITAIPDSVVEGEESVIMNITTVTGGTELGTQAVTLTIRNTTESTPDPEPEPEPDPTCAEAGSPWTDCEVGDEMFSGLYIWYSSGGTHYAMYLNASSLAYGSVMNHNAYSSNGQTNTTSILSAEAAAPAAKYCNDLSNDLGSDWWMPTAGHIRTMAINGLVATSIEVWGSKQNGAHSSTGVTLSYDSGDISEGSSWGSNTGIAKTATHRVICATIIGVS